DRRPLPKAKPPEAPVRAARRGWLGPWHATARRYPIALLVVLMLASNVFGSFFNVMYNNHVIATNFTQGQQEVFETVAIPVYNVVAYPVCLGVMLYLFWPLRRCLWQLRAGEPIEPGFLEFCRRRVINLPSLQLWVNACGWLPGIIFFPLVICALGGTHEWLT